jgi:transcriptional regulator with XRE-family HTH domain
MKQLKEFRILMDKTPEEMAKDLKMSLSMYEKIEYGYRKPSNNFINQFKKKYPIIDTNIFFTK